MAGLKMRTASRLCSAGITSPNDVPQTSSKASNILDRFPNELKLMVLENMSDIASLRALIHVLPAYLHLYDMHEEQILTDVTLRTLKGEGLDMQRLGTWLRLCVPKTGPSALDLKSAFESHYCSVHYHSESLAPRN